MSSLSSSELQRIAETFVTRSMRIGRRPDGRFESVALRYNESDPTCVDFAKKVEEACWKVGAHVLSIPITFARARKELQLRPEDSLKEVNPLNEALSKTMDARIFLGEFDDPNWTMGLAEKWRLNAPVRQRLTEIMDQRGVRWAFFGWPVPGAAAAYGMDIDAFRSVFFDSIRESFSPKMKELISHYSSRLAAKRKIRIIADDGTDLSLTLEGRPLLEDDSTISAEDIERGDIGLNIPSGEVFFAPVENSASGQIIFDEVAIPGFGRASKLKLTFKDGKVVEFVAEHGADNFRNFLDANTGEKDRIAELGIGCNPGARYTGGSIIIDEKIFGTIHVAIGNNTGAYHGTNKASSHLDMIKDMSHGRLLADNETVMKAGQPA